MFDIYAVITDRITAQLENGIIPWNKPWTTNLAISRSTGKPYTGINRFLLDPGEYLTFKEITKLGGRVKKGEKASMVVFWKWIDKKDDKGQLVLDANGEPEQIPFLRYSNVFEVGQCEGIERKYSPETYEHETDKTAEDVANGYIKRSGVRVEKILSNDAYYSPILDTVRIPALEQYKSVSEYYSTFFHELAHSTGHKSRLNRLVSTAHFGSEDYSKEELVAEITSSALVNYCGLETEASFRNNSAYIQNWLKALKNDKRMIVSAAGKAEKAFALIADI